MVSPMRHAFGLADLAVVLVMTPLAGMAPVPVAVTVAPMTVSVRNAAGVGIHVMLADDNLVRGSGKRCGSADSQGNCKNQAFHDVLS